jgi:hypothetical protein
LTFKTPCPQPRSRCPESPHHDSSSYCVCCVTCGAGASRGRNASRAVPGLRFCLPLSCPVGFEGRGYIALSCEIDAKLLRHARNRGERAPRPGPWYLYVTSRRRPKRGHLSFADLDVVPHCCSRRAMLAGVRDCRSRSALGSFLDARCDMRDAGCEIGGLTMRGQPGDWYVAAILCVTM